MKFDYEKLLHETLKPSDGPSEELLKEVKSTCLGKQPAKVKWSKYQRIAAAMSCCVILAGTATIANAATDNLLLNNAKSFLITCFNSNGEQQDIDYYTDSEGNVMFSFTADEDDGNFCPVIYKCGKKISSYVSTISDSATNESTGDYSVLGCISGINTNEVEGSHTYTFRFNADDNDYSFVSIIPGYYSEEDAIWELRQLFYETMPDNENREEHMAEYKNLKKNCKDSLVTKAISYAIDDLESEKDLCIESIPIYKDHSTTKDTYKPEDIEDFAWISIDLSTLEFKSNHAVATVDSVAGYQGTFHVSIFKNSETGEYSILNLGEE